MKLFVFAAFLAVAATAPSSYKPEYKAPSYPTPSYTTPNYATPSYATPSYPEPAYPTPAYPAPAYPAPAYPAPAYPAPAYPAPAYPTPSYNKDNKYADITITSQSDERNLDGSSQWSYAQSDYTTREESQVQKKMQGVTYDSYGKESYGEVLGNTNKGSSYWISPEGQKFTLTWTADDAGFQPKGDHLPVAPVHVYELPVAPVHVYELPVAPVHEYELPVAPALPYARTGLGY